MDKSILHPFRKRKLNFYKLEKFIYGDFDFSPVDGKKRNNHSNSPVFPA